MNGEKDSALLIRRKAERRLWEMEKERTAEDLAESKFPPCVSAVIGFVAATVLPAARGICAMRT